MLKRTSRTCASIAGVLACAALALLPRAASACPDDTVRLIVGYSQGGTGGIVATTIAEPLARTIGQKVVIEYQPSGSGSGAARAVAASASDGCTLLLGQTAEIAINPVVSHNLGYDLEKDLRVAAMIANTPLALIVRSAAPYQTVDTLADAARASRPALSFASAGRTTPGYYAGELLRLRTKSSLAHISYDGGGVALQAVIDGRASLYFPALSTAIDEANKGSIRILAVTSQQRSQAVPQIPTLNEVGLGPFSLDLWLGLFVPHGTSTDIVAKLNRSLNEVLVQQNVVSSLGSKGLNVTPMGVDQSVSFVQSERAKYKNFLDAEFCAECPW